MVIISPTEYNVGTDHNGGKYGRISSPKEAMCYVSVLACTIVQLKVCVMYACTDKFRNFFQPT